MPRRRKKNIWFNLKNKRPSAKNLRTAFVYKKRGTLHPPLHTLRQLLHTSHPPFRTLPFRTRRLVFTWLNRKYIYGMAQAKHRQGKDKARIKRG